jgi:hypothetical protein
MSIYKIIFLESSPLSGLEICRTIHGISYLYKLIPKAIQSHKYCKYSPILKDYGKNECLALMNNLNI